MPKNTFLTDDFLLYNQTGIGLYNKYAKNKPIIDYHCHLSPEDIADDKQFDNLTQIWIEGDHYKWRAMRANGIDEKYITGNASDFEKFQKWAETVPKTIRNPLYHWTHLELKNYFGIEKLLNPATAEEIYIEASALLQKPAFSVKNLLRKMNVQMVGTTDDPTDDLKYHQEIQKQAFEIMVLPSFRPDKCVNIENKLVFINWINALENVCKTKINNYQDLLNGLKKRHNYFHELGCRISDHGLDTFYAEEFSLNEINVIFKKALQNGELTNQETKKYKASILFELAVMDHEKGWTQQFHVGAIRNNNSKMKNAIGFDTGFDSIGDSNHADSMSGFFDKLNADNTLAKTIIYNLNPKDSEVFAAMAANFNEAPNKGKMQYGAAWWFLDQKDGIEKQLNVLSNFGLLSNFIGMLTDSRSFLSFPRHDYFRRILCNIMGDEVEKQQLPNDLDFIGNTIADICYKNALTYFNFPNYADKI